MSNNRKSRNLLRKISRISVFIILMTCSAISSGATVNGDSLRFEVLMSSKMLEEVHLSETFINSIAITPNRYILLSSPNQFYLLGWGGIQPFAHKTSGSISSFAYTQENSLMAIRGNELCYFDSTGNLARLHKLPEDGMELCAGKNVMYVFDHKKGKSKYSLYTIAKGGKYMKLFDVPEPVQAAIELKNMLVFATGNGLYSFDIRKKELKAQAALPKDMEIISIAADTINSRIYFSTTESLYAVKGSNALLVNNMFGGMLRYFDNGLLMFDTRKNLMMRITGLENIITATTLTVKADADSKKTVETLTNESIINLVKAELSDEFIIKIINKSDVNFNMSVDSMILLSDQNVSSAVIKEMKNAMKRKAGSGSGGSN